MTTVKLLAACAAYTQHDTMQIRRIDLEVFNAFASQFGPPYTQRHQLAIIDRASRHIIHLDGIKQSLLKVISS